MQTQQTERERMKELRRKFGKGSTMEKDHEREREAWRMGKRMQEEKRDKIRLNTWS